MNQEQIGHYQILDLLGRGAMADVFRAYDPRLDRMVAIKRITPPDSVSNSAWQQRFQREVRAAARLNHPHIITIHDVDLESDPPYVVMEWLAGGTLKDRMHENKTLPWREALNILLPLCDALAFAHQAGIVHRDVKPANVMFTSGEASTLKLVDFGLAFWDSSSRMTQMGNIIGTPAYMAPEQARGDPVDAGSDIFSLGVLFFELITGQNPLEGDSLAQTLMALISPEPIDMAPLDGLAPPQLVEVLGRALVKDLNLRYDNCETFIRDMNACLREETPVLESEPLISQDDLAQTRLLIDKKPGTRYLRLLGPVQVELIQKEIKTQEVKPPAVPRFRSRRTMGLLGYLATEQRPIGRDYLAALFWPDETPSKGRGNLRRELHNLAKVLPDCWESDRQSVAFLPSNSTAVDTNTLLELEAKLRWNEAAELLRGEFLEGLYLDDNPEFENWLLGERERWRWRTEIILTRVIKGHTRRGRYRDALNYCQHLLQLMPWNEETHRQIMRLQTWTGQRGAALRQFETCKQVLKDELDVEPDGDTIALYQQIHAGELAIPPQLPAFLTEEKAKHKLKRSPFVGRDSELSQLDNFLDQALSGRGRVIFISGGPGRGKTTLLKAFTCQAMEKHPNLLVASGKCNAYSGVGDPYLPYREVMGMLTGDVENRWDAGAITREHAQRLWAVFPLVIQTVLDHGPHLVDVLTPGAALLSRAVLIDEGNDANWLPRLRETVNRHASSMQEVEQNYLFQQVVDVLRTVSGKKPVLLVLDDLQWADAASISLLFHLGRSLIDTDSRLLITCAYRPEEVTLGHTSNKPGQFFSKSAGYYATNISHLASVPKSQVERHPLDKVLTEFKRIFGDVWIRLDRGEDSEERKFVDDLLDAEPNQLGEEFRVALFDRTQGHPLFTVELLRDMQERGDLQKDELGSWIQGSTLSWNLLPARVEAVIEERISRLDPELQELLTIASVEGEVFTAQVLAEVQKTPVRSTLRRLSVDLERQHRLVREGEELYTGQQRLFRFYFGHALFQDYLYQQLSTGERRLLHEEIGIAIEKVYAGKLDEMAVPLAHHFHTADDYHRAFHYFSLAGERATRLYATAEAITHYTQAIELADIISPDVVSLTELYRGRGLAHEILGEFERARLDHTQALQIAQEAGDRNLEWCAMIDLGKLWRSRDYNQARDCFEAALELAREVNNPTLLADSLNWIGNWYANVDQSLQAVEYHREALKIVEQGGDQHKLANTLDLLGIATLLGSNCEASVQYYNQAIALFRKLDDRPRLATSLLGRASNFSMMGLLHTISARPPRDPLRDLNEAQQIAVEINSAPDQAWAYWAKGSLLTRHGQFGQALENLQSGLQIASRIGHREFVAANRFGIGDLYNALLAPERAQPQLEEALALTIELHSQNLIHDVTGSLAKTYIMLDDFSAAQSCLESVLSAQTPMDTLGTRYCWYQLGELALNQGNPSLAIDIAERLIASTPGISTGRVILFPWKLKGEAVAALGKVGEGISLLRAAIENAQGVGERFFLWQVQASLGRLYHKMGDQAAAEIEYSATRSLINELTATIPDNTLKENFLQRAFHSIS